MANDIKINTTRLGSDADQIGNHISNMEKQINSMKSSIDQLMSTWEGSAKSAFYQAFEDDRVAAMEIIKELKSLHSLECQAKTKYENCESQVSSLVDSIKI